MNVFEYAMKMENDGRDFYLEHAEKATVPAFKRILEDLANDELKHYRIFKAMKEGGAAKYNEAEKTEILATVKNVFEEMKSKGEEHSFAADAKQIWEHAREVEKKAEEFYREKANELDNDDQKAILNKIADEEHRHWVTMEQVIRFLEGPKQWLEDAEWGNLKE